MTDPKSASTGDGLSERAEDLTAVPSEIKAATDPGDTTTEVVLGGTTALTDNDVAKDGEGVKETPAVDSDSDEKSEPAKTKRRISWPRALVYAVLPGLALLLAIAAGLLTWQDVSTGKSRTAAIESVAAAKDATIGLLSYRPDSAEKDLDSARDRLTGSFKESYTQLIHDVVIPGAKQKHISSVATVPAAASVSASGNHAVVLLFVNQTTVVGMDPPTDSSSSVRVELDRINGRWLVSGFDPI